MLQEEDLPNYEEDWYVLVANTPYTVPAQLVSVSKKPHLGAIVTPDVSRCTPISIWTSASSFNDSNTNTTTNSNNTSNTNNTIIWRVFRGFEPTSIEGKNNHETNSCNLRCLNHGVCYTALLIDVYLPLHLIRYLALQ